MIETRVFDIDEVTQRTRLFHYDHTNDSFTIETNQDVTDLIETNKALSNDASGRWGEWQRVASIPMNLYMQLREQGVFRDQKAIRKWLNDRDNQLFRTRPGKV